jgi:hypothetical protein
LNEKHVFYLFEVSYAESKAGHVNRKFPVSVPSDVKSVEFAVLDDRSGNRSAGNEPDREN